VSEQNRDNEKAESIKRSKKRLRSVLIIISGVISCLLLWRLFFYESMDEQLAAIEAAHAIPDSENAAVIYNELLKDSNTAELLEKQRYLDDKILNMTLTEPWFGKNYPEFADWISKHQNIIDKLLEVSKYEKCYFPILIPESGVVPIHTEQPNGMLELGRFLIRAAYNDTAEGRIDEALKKYICVINMGRHCHQQPVSWDFATGVGLEALGLRGIRFLIVKKEINEKHLHAIEAALNQSDKDWDKNWKNMFRVETLYAKKRPKVHGLRNRIKVWWQLRNYEKPIIDNLSRSYLLLLTDRRGSRILVGLRLYKNKTGKWPENLDNIKQIVSEEALIDPHNNNSFVYKLSGDSFILYSKGLNNIDENGQIRNGADDWQIWP
jgi:hypothetical protein